jgi:hypothetical protein
MIKREVLAFAGFEDPLGISHVSLPLVGNHSSKKIPNKSE